MLGTVFLPYFWLASLLLQPFLLIEILSHGVVEEHDLPGEMYPGQTAIATWSLETGNTGGFARFQIQFPPGMIAESADNGGASFSFEDDRGKFIWIDAPANETIFLKLSLTATSEFNGGMITQWFSYISEGTRKDVEFEPHHVSAGTAQVESLLESQSQGRFAIKRTWRQEGPDVGLMTLSITGHEQGQFLKVQESLGENCKAEPVNDGDASLRDLFEQSILYVWQQAPADSIKLQYRVMANSPDCWQQISGTGSTVLNGNIIVTEVSQLSRVSPEAMVEKKSEIAVQKAAISVKNEAKKKIDEPIENSSIHYKVQILASHQRVGASHFSQHYDFKKALLLEEHGEWIKYVTGSFRYYNEARNERETISEQHRLPGPFVTAYRDKRRITVQEALLTTKQNWIP